MVRSNKSKTVEESSSVSENKIVDTPTPPVSVESSKKKKETKETTKEQKQVKDEVSKKSKKDKVSVSTESVASSQNVVSETPLVEEHPVSNEDVAISFTEVEQPPLEQSVEFISKLQQICVLVSTLKTEYRILEKKWSRELKNSQKLNNRKKKRASNRAPSGFVKPTRISDELAKFLDKPTGTEMARTDVTRDINKYIRTNDLQDKSNGRKINPDLKLASLLKVDEKDELTYFNLQKYMSPHFSKNVKVENSTHLDS